MANKKKTHRVNIDIPVHLWDDFQKILFNEKLANSSSLERTLQSDLLVKIIERGLETWKKRLTFLKR